jgi:hypothetical protein
MCIYRYINNIGTLSANIKFACLRLRNRMESESLASMKGGGVKLQTRKMSGHVYYVCYSIDFGSVFTILLLDCRTVPTVCFFFIVLHIPFRCELKLTNGLRFTHIVLYIGLNTLYSYYSLAQCRTSCIVLYTVLFSFMTFHRVCN